ncbi:calcium-binding EF-hand family protein [Striga asiatica]|uniref:Calcium-binding EF-hand family protein n=1 Tax=Striga asiatica TaxID=4170 RepID=A0A5A7QJT3_STRAF|nr:calcium-binding EF-hand family protein [Striga asiatica]
MVSLLFYSIQNWMGRLRRSKPSKANQTGVRHLDLIMGISTQELRSDAEHGLYRVNLGANSSSVYNERIDCLLFVLVMSGKKGSVPYDMRIQPEKYTLRHLGTEKFSLLRKKKPWKAVKPKPVLSSKNPMGVQISASKRPREMRRIALSLVAGEKD